MHDSDVQSVYLDLERKEPPPNKGCSVYVAPGASPYHAGLGVVGNGPVVLDFTGTGVNLAELNVSYYDSKHETRGNTLIIQNVPSWTKEANGAYIGLADRNWAAHPGLPHIKAPSCTAQ
jgi:hypothetical protein